MSSKTVGSVDSGDKAVGSGAAGGRGVLAFDLAIVVDRKKITQLEHSHLIRNYCVDGTNASNENATGRGKVTVYPLKGSVSRRNKTVNLYLDNNVAS